MPTMKTFTRRAAQAALTAAILAIPPQSASALLCFLPTPMEKLVEAQESPHTYRVYLGSLDAGVADNGEAVTAGFTGHQLGPTGFDTPASLDMKLQSSCHTGWCGSISADTDLVIFAREVGGQQVVESGACGGSTFIAPDAEVMKAMAACVRGEDCSIE